MHSAAVLLLDVLLAAGGAALAPLHGILTHLAADLLRRVALTPRSPQDTSDEWQAHLQVRSHGLHTMCVP